MLRHRFLVMRDQYSACFGGLEQNFGVIEPLESSLMAGLKIDGRFAPQNARYNIAVQIVVGLKSWPHDSGANVSCRAALSFACRSACSRRALKRCSLVRISHSFK